jgi:hypothetical protein
MADLCGGPQFALRTPDSTAGLVVHFLYSVFIFVVAGGGLVRTLASQPGQRVHMSASERADRVHFQAQILPMAAPADQRN